MTNYAMTVQFETNEDIGPISAKLIGRLVAISQYLNLPMTVKFEKQLDTPVGTGSTEVL